MGAAEDDDSAGQAATESGRTGQLRSHETRTLGAGAGAHAASDRESLGAQEHVAVSGGGPSGPRPPDSVGGHGTMRRMAVVAAVLASYGLARLVYNAVVLRRLGAETVGTVNIALSMAVLVSLPVSAGLAPAVSRFFPLLASERARSGLRRWALATGAVWMSLPLAIFVVVYGAALKFPYGIPFAPIVMGWSALYAVYALCRAELFAGERPARALALEIAGVVLFGVALMTLLLRGRGEWIPFSVYYLPAVAWVAWHVMHARGPRPRSGAGIAEDRVPGRREMRGFAWFSLLGSAASLGIMYFTTIVVSVSLDLARAGRWATLFSVATPLLLAPRTLNASFFPRLSLLGATDGAAFRRLCRLHQQFSSLLALAAVGGALTFFRPVLAIVLGDASDPQLPGAWILLCFACFGIFRGEPVITSCAALGRARLTAMAAFSGAAVCVAVWALALPRAGMPGVAAGYMTYTAATPLIVLVASRQRGPSPPVFFFPSDAVFAAVAVATLMGLTRSLAGQVLALTAIVATVAWGLTRIRRDSRSTG